MNIVRFPAYQLDFAILLLIFCLNSAIVTEEYFEEYIEEYIATEREPCSHAAHFSQVNCGPV